jgi:twitching motility two-component system response regulator PilG
MLQMSNAKPLVMIVDDSKTILRTAKSFLEPAYEVAVVENGFLALAELAKRVPDVLLMDVMMPLLDGYTATLAIRNNPDFQDLPIVMLSSKDSPFDKARGALIGCSDYLTKPFAKDALLEAVRKHVRND